MSSPSGLPAKSLRLPDVREVELVDVQVDGGQVVTWRAEDVEPEDLGNTTARTP